MTNGLALKSVPLADLLDEARAYAKTIIDKPRAAIAMLKSIYVEGAQMSVAEGTALELARFGEYMAREPYGREGYRAFREKREPDWRNVARDDRRPAPQGLRRHACRPGPLPAPPGRRSWRWMARCTPTPR